MPSTPYDLVQDDQDLRVPLHAEQAFFHGITFQAKFVGWEEVPRPNTRAEIVQAMRRIRYECKVQNLKKRKVTIQISVNGVRVVLKKRRRKKKNWTNDPEEIELLNHPIYRIFYVSHDSSDLKIFSYIARDASTDTFKCSVFKSHKKSQAMRIVRTVGQAFEVCHKFNLHKNSLEPNDERSDVSSSELLDVEQISEQQLSDDGGLCVLASDTPKKDHLAITPDLNHTQPQRPNHLELLPTQSSLRKSPNLLCDVEDKSPGSPSSPRTEITQLKDQLEAQAQQTRQALGQLMLVREQLISETNARIEAQARTQQLLQQNRELLEHLASLGAYNEQQSAGLTSANIGMAPQLSSTAKVARWFQQLPWHTASLSRPESGFVSGDSRSEKYQEDHFYGGMAVKETDDLCDEFLLVEGSSTIWTKLSAKKRRKLLGMRLGKVTTF
ncbi:capon-like protein isoform X6 [Drosophila sulfurigaster albostrigata]|uniref:Capon-like protein isoform X6 n=1 Tax=Drosophila albomicans TaxID=7291 RepID=A0A6P8YY08_DROAB|nr:capon-like protein isoform X6 [Drosophila albomicans]XP_062131889.1 capon-like protein isoform X6 [Drosophila sulfurigaster albostrigata]